MGCENLKRNNNEALILWCLNENLTDENNEKFINEALHFVVNEEVCSKYDTMRINYVLRKIKSREINNYIKLSVSYIFAIYKLSVANLIDTSTKLKCNKLYFEISDIITRFVTMRCDEKELIEGAAQFINKIGVNDIQNALTLSKLATTKIKY